MDSVKLFRTKAETEGLKQLGPNASPDEYCVGVLYDDKTPMNANVKKDLMWFRCKLDTTVGVIMKAYESGVALPQELVLRFNGSILQPTDTILKLNPNLDKVILIEAVSQTGPNSSNSTSQKGPLQSRSVNDVIIKSEPGTLTKHASPSVTHVTHALPYQLLPPPGADKYRLVSVMDLICKYEGTSKDALTEHVLTYGELMLLFTMVDFVHEKLAQIRDSQGPRFTSFTDADRQSVLNQWHALTPELCQWYQKRAMLFIDSSRIENGSATQEMIRFKNENAGFYAFFFSIKDKYLAHINTFGTDMAFMMIHSDWREMSHRKIAFWVRNGRNLRYTPITTPANGHQTQNTQTATSSEHKADDTSDSNLSKPKEPEPEPSEQFSLQSLFTGCTPELLEAGVEHGVNLLERLKEPLRRVAPDLDAAEWLKSIDNLQKQATQPKTIVGVVGNTGAGKSSVINAMLDEERLVPTNCMRACTAVVTEISHNHEEIPYRAEIEFITEEDWQKELHVLFSDLLDSNGNISREATNQDTEAGVAYAKIKAVYPEYTREMLQKTSAEKLLKHPAVQQVLGGKKDIADSNPAEFYKHLQCYVDSKEKTTSAQGHSEKNKPAKPSKQMEYWPLIKVVRIYVKAAALSTGAVIVDLPGVHDSNAARARVAEGYMKQCTGLWIVAPITRAVDDKAAKSLLGETFKRQLKMDCGFDSVTFICSKTDDISILEAQESLGLEQEMGSLWAKSDQYNSEKREHQKRLDELKRTRAECTAVVDEIDEQIEKWEALKDGIEDGKTVYAPRDKSSKKRKRGSTSNFSGTPQKKQRSSDSDLNSVYSDNDNEDGPDSEEDESETQGEPLTVEAVEERLSELKTTKKEGRRQRQEIEAEMKVVRKQIAELNEADATVQAEMSHIAISGRNEYSRGAIQQDFASGIRELDHELAEETDASNFNPDVDVRDYDKVAQSLPVFCVSSRAYQKLQGRFQKEPNVPGFQTIEETEVPQLQAHCRKLTEASREANSRRFLNTLDQLLNSLRLVASSDDLRVTDKQKATRAAIVESAYNQLDKEFVEHIKNIREKIAEEIESDITEACNKATPTASGLATETVSRWGAPVNRFNRAEGGYYWATYKALCRRDGAYAAHDWNAQLIEPIMKAAAPGWEKIFSRRIQTIFSNAGSESANLLEKFHSNVHEKITQTTGPLGSIHMLSQQLRIYQQTVKELFNQQVLDMSTQSRDINRMFEPVVVESMVPAYTTCVEERGPGSYMRMKDAMASHVATNCHSMFEKSVDQVEAALHRMLESGEEGLLASTDTALMSLKRDYMSAVVGSQSAALRREKQEILKHIMESEASYKQLTQPQITEDVSSETATNGQDQESKLESNENAVLVKEEKTTETLPPSAAVSPVKQETSDAVSVKNHEISAKPDPEDDAMATAQLEADETNPSADLFNWDA